ncbi:IS1595 family transposase [Phaeobacter inhibens]|uniref:IS1595 family transposase n=1 Tax=Phaeobacter inhibens TaxID=221822 RepID=UPI0021A5B757|nr:IS1595 family transposase [Phaeobacter inhibens]UWR49526.1 IS1595 family transposase [Phaeobacter inhibens]
MKKKSFDRILKGLRGLTSDQAAALLRSVQEMAANNAAKTAIDTQGREACCPHCQSPNRQKWGRTRTGAQRYRCNQCGKTFNGRTGSSIAHLQRLDLFYRVLEDMLTAATPSSVRQLARRFGVNKDTAWRWRKTILQVMSQSVTPLSGIVEVDETFVKESRKGSREWVRHERDPAINPKPPRLRWYEYKLTGTLKKRGLSRWQLPILTAVDRAGNRYAEQLPDRREQTINNSLLPIICPDAALCSDGFSAYAKFAKATGLSHFVLGTKPGTRKIQQSFHIQNVNALHSRLKAFLRPFKGPAKKYLDGYVDWYFARENMEVDCALSRLLDCAKP